MIKNLNEKLIKSKSDLNDNLTKIQELNEKLENKNPFEEKYNKIKNEIKRKNNEINLFEEKNKN
jgi:hypothetical protein